MLTAGATTLCCLVQKPSAKSPYARRSPRVLDLSSRRSSAVNSHATPQVWRATASASGRTMTDRIPGIGAAAIRRVVRRAARSEPPLRRLNETAANRIRTVAAIEISLPAIIDAATGAMLQRWTNQADRAAMR